MFKSFKKLFVLLFTLVILTSTFQPKAVKASTMDVPEVPQSISPISPLSTVYADDLDLIANYLNDITFGQDISKLVVPVDIKEKGGLVVFLGEYDNEYSSIYCDLYEDQECTKKVGYTLSLSKGDTVDYQTYPINKAGIYYLELELLRTYEHNEEMKFSIACATAGTDRDLESKKSYLSYQESDFEPVLYKVVVPKTGLVSFMLEGDSSTNSIYGNVSILNSKKKTLSEEAYISSPRNSDDTYGPVTQYYMLTKGTYYFKVDLNSTGFYTIEYKLSNVTDKSGSSMSKATNIKLGGASVKGYCTISDKTSKVDWYKVKLTKKRSVSFTITTKIDDALTFEFCDSHGDTLWSGTKTIYAGDNTIKLRSDGQWTAGTYYIKVTKNNKNSSGYYAISAK